VTPKSDKAEKKETPRHQGKKEEKKERSLRLVINSATISTAAFRALSASSGSIEIAPTLA